MTTFNLQASVIAASRRPEEQVGEAIGRAARLVLGLLLFVLGVATASADDKILYDLFKERTRKAENARIIAGEDKNKVRRESDQLIQAAWEEVLKQHANAGVGLLGAPSLNGEFPVSHIDNGIIASLQFQFIDSATGLPTGLGDLLAAGVARVDYEVNLDPNLEDASNLPIYTFYGSSTDVGSLFKLSYTPAGFEDDIQATPYDASGNVIVFPGVGGTNVAIGSVVNIHYVPEPSTLLLAGIPLLFATGSYLRRRLRGVKDDVATGT